MATAARNLDLQLTVTDKNVTKTVSALRKQTVGLGKALAAVTAGITAVASVKIFSNAFKESRKLEEQMKVIQGLAGMTDTEFSKFERTTREVARGIGSLTALDLAKIEKTGVVMGIAKDDLIDFSKQVGYGSIALSSFGRNTELLSTHLAKQMKIFGLGTKDINAMMSAMSFLETNTAASALQISEFNQGLAAHAKMMKLSQAEASAWGATLIATGMDASKAARQIRSSYNVFLQHMTSDKNNSLDAAVRVFNSAVDGGAASVERLEKITGQTVQQMGGLRNSIETALGVNASATFKAINLSMGKMTDETQRGQEALALYGSVGANSMQVLALNMEELEQRIQATEEQFVKSVHIQSIYDTIASSNSETLKVLGSIINDIALQIGGPLLTAYATLVKVSLIPLATQMSNWLQDSTRVQTFFKVIIPDAAKTAGLALNGVATMVKAIAHILWIASDTVVRLFRLISSNMEGTYPLWDVLAQNIKVILNLLSLMRGNPFASWIDSSQFIQVLFGKIIPTALSTTINFIGKLLDAVLPLGSDALIATPWTKAFRQMGLGIDTFAVKFTQFTRLINAVNLSPIVDSVNHVLKQASTVIGHLEDISRTFISVKTHLISLIVAGNKFSQALAFIQLKNDLQAIFVIFPQMSAAIGKTMPIVSQLVNTVMSIGKAFNYIAEIGWRKSVFPELYMWLNTLLSPLYILLDLFQTIGNLFAGKISLADAFFQTINLAVAALVAPFKFLFRSINLIFSTVNALIANIVAAIANLGAAIYYAFTQEPEKAMFYLIAAGKNIVNQVLIPIQLMADVIKAIFYHIQNIFWEISDVAIALKDIILNVISLLASVSEIATRIKDGFAGMFDSSGGFNSLVALGKGEGLKAFEQRIHDLSYETMGFADSTGKLIKMVTSRRELSVPFRDFEFKDLIKNFKGFWREAIRVTHNHPLNYGLSDGDLSFAAALAEKLRKYSRASLEEFRAITSGGTLHKISAPLGWPSQEQIKAAYSNLSNNKQSLKLALQWMERAENTENFFAKAWNSYQTSMAKKVSWQTGLWYREIKGYIPTSKRALMLSEQMLDVLNKSRQQQIAALAVAFNYQERLEDITGRSIVDMALGIEDTFGNIINMIKKVTEASQGLGEAIIQSFAGNGSQALSNSLEDITGQSIAKIALGIEDTFGNIINIIKKVAEAFQELGKTIIQFFTNNESQTWAASLEGITTPIKEFLRELRPVEAAIETITKIIYGIVDAIEMIAIIGWRRSVFPEFVHQIDITVRHLAWFDRNLKHAVGTIGVLGRMIHEVWRTSLLFILVRDVIRQMVDVIEEMTGIDIRKFFRPFGELVDTFKARGLVDSLHDLSDYIQTFFNDLAAQAEGSPLYFVASVLRDFVNFQVQTYENIVTGGLEAVGRLLSGDVSGAIYVALETIGTHVEFMIERWAWPLRTLVPQIAEAQVRIGQSAHRIIVGLGREVFEFMALVEPTYDTLLSRTALFLGDLVIGIERFEGHLAEILNNVFMLISAIFGYDLKNIALYGFRTIVEVWDALIDILSAPIERASKRAGKAFVNLGHEIGQFYLNLAESIINWLNFDRFEALFVQLARLGTNALRILNRGFIQFAGAAAAQTIDVIGFLIEKTLALINVFFLVEHVVYTYVYTPLQLAVKSILALGAAFVAFSLFMNQGLTAFEQLKNFTLIISTFLSEGITSLGSPAQAIINSILSPIGDTILIWAANTFGTSSIITTIILEIINTIDRAIAHIPRIFERMGLQIEGVGDTIYNALTKMETYFRPAIEALERFGETWQAYGILINNELSIFEKANIAISSFSAIMGNFYQSIRNSVAGTPFAVPVNMIIGYVRAQVALIRDLSQTLITFFEQVFKGQFPEAIRTALEAITVYLTYTAARWVNLFKLFFPRINAELQAALDRFRSILTTASTEFYEIIKHVFAGLAGGSSGNVYELAETIVKGVAVIFDGVGEGVETTISYISTAFEQIQYILQDLLAGDFQSALLGIADLLKTVWDAVIDGLADALENFFPGIADKFRTFADGLGNAIHGILSGFITGFDTSKLGNLWDALLSIITNVTDQFEDLTDSGGLSGWETFGAMIAGVVGSIIDVLTFLVKAIAMSIEGWTKLILFFAVLLEAFGEVKAWITTIGDSFTTLFKNIGRLSDWKQIFYPLQALADGLWWTIELIMDTVTAVTLVLAAFGVGPIGQGLKMTAKIFSSSFHAMGVSIRTFLQIFSKKRLVESVSGYARHISGMQVKLGKLGGSFKTQYTKISTVPNTIIGRMSDLVKATNEAGTAWSFFVANLKRAITWVPRYFMRAFNTKPVLLFFAKTLTNVIIDFKTQLPSMFQGFGDFLVDHFDEMDITISNWAKGIPEAIKNVGAEIVKWFVAPFVEAFAILDQKLDQWAAKLNPLNLFKDKGETGASGSWEISQEVTPAGFGQTAPVQVPIQADPNSVRDFGDSMDRAFSGNGQAIQATTQQIDTLADSIAHADDELWRHSLGPSLEKFNSTLERSVTRLEPTSSSLENMADHIQEGDARLQSYGGQLRTVGEETGEVVVQFSEAIRQSGLMTDSIQQNIRGYKILSNDIEDTLDVITKSSAALTDVTQGSTEAAKNLADELTQGRVTRGVNAIKQIRDSGAEVAKIFQTKTTPEIRAMFTEAVTKNKELNQAFNVLTDRSNRVIGAIMGGHLEALNLFKGDNLKEYTKATMQVMTASQLLTQAMKEGNIPALQELAKTSPELVAILGHVQNVTYGFEDLVSVVKNKPTRALREMAVEGKAAILELEKGYSGVVTSANEWDLSLNRNQSILKDLGLQASDLTINAANAQKVTAGALSVVEKSFEGGYTNLYVLESQLNKVSAAYETVGNRTLEAQQIFQNAMDAKIAGLRKQGNQAVTELTFMNKNFENTMAYGNDLVGGTFEEALTGIKAIVSDISQYDLSTQRDEYTRLMQVAEQARRRMLDFAMDETNILQDRKDAYGLAYEAEKELIKSRQALLKHDQDILKKHVSTELQWINQIGAETKKWLFGQNNIERALKQAGFEVNEYTVQAIELAKEEYKVAAAMEKHMDKLDKMVPKTEEAKEELKGITNVAAQTAGAVADVTTSMAQQAVQSVQVITNAATSSVDVSDFIAKMKRELAGEPAIREITEPSSDQQDRIQEEAQFFRQLSQETQNWLIQQRNVEAAFRKAGIAYNSYTVAGFEQFKADQQETQAINNKKDALENLARATNEVSAKEQRAAQDRQEYADPLSSTKQEVRRAVRSTVSLDPIDRGITRRGTDNMSNLASAINQLKGSIQDLSRSISGSGTARRFHSGGLASDEVPAILQTGEYVLSRRHIALMKQNPLLLNWLKAVGVTFHKGGPVRYHEGGGVEHSHDSKGGIILPILDPNVAPELDYTIEQLKKVGLIVDEINEAPMITIDPENGKRADEAIKQARAINREQYEGRGWADDTLNILKEQTYARQQSNHLEKTGQKLYEINGIAIAHTGNTAETSYANISKVTDKIVKDTIKTQKAVKESTENVSAATKDMAEVHATAQAQVQQQQVQVIGGGGGTRRDQVEELAKLSRSMAVDPAFEAAGAMAQLYRGANYERQLETLESIQRNTSPKDSEQTIAIRQKMEEFVGSLNGLNYMTDTKVVSELREMNALLKQSRLQDKELAKEQMVVAKQGLRGAYGEQTGAGLRRATAAAVARDIQTKGTPRAALQSNNVSINVEGRGKSDEELANLIEKKVGGALTRVARDVQTRSVL